MLVIFRNDSFGRMGNFLCWDSFCNAFDICNYSRKRSDDNTGM